MSLFSSLHFVTRSKKKNQQLTHSLQQDVMMQMEISQHDIHIPKNMFLVPWGKE
jgi:hypothetical protein